MSPYLSLAALSLALTLSGCSGGEERTEDREPVSQAPPASEPDDEILTEERVALSETGWVTIGRDGAVYTTHLDANGKYRDFRNGTFLQGGVWQRGESGELCFVPDAMDRYGACWEMNPRNDTGTILARRADDDDRAVELRRVSYLPPAASASAERSGQTDADDDDAAPIEPEG